MFLTKETNLPAPVTAWLAGLPGGGYYVTVQGAAHDSFTDGPLLLAALLPWPSRAGAITAQVRAYTRAFFDQTLLARPALRWPPPTIGRTACA
jgi:hypothetical protein